MNETNPTNAKKGTKERNTAQNKRHRRRNAPLPSYETHTSLSFVANLGTHTSQGFAT